MQYCLSRLISLYITSNNLHMVLLRPLVKVFIQCKLDLLLVLSLVSGCILLNKELFVYYLF